MGGRGKRPQKKAANWIPFFYRTRITKQNNNKKKTNTTPSKLHYHPGDGERERGKGWKKKSIQHTAQGKREKQHTPACQPAR